MRDEHSGKLFLLQQRYIKKILKRFEMQDAKSISTPLTTHFKLSISDPLRNEEDERYMSKVRYSRTVGSLMYAMVCIRPDISHSVSVVNRYIASSGKLH